MAAINTRLEALISKVDAIYATVVPSPPPPSPPPPTPPQPPPPRPPTRGGLLYNVTTFVGSGNQAWQDGVGSMASFYHPYGVAMDNVGNLFVTDTLNNRIRKVSADGTVITLVGNGYAAWQDGVGLSASFNYPVGVAVDNAGNVFVVDHVNNRIRKVAPNGTVITFAGSGNAAWQDGVGSSASFSLPAGVAVDNSGNVFVADQHNNRIRKITPNGTVTTLAGSGEQAWQDGVGLSASFYSPVGVAVDNAGTVYVADCSNHRIRKVTADGNVTTLAGSGDQAWQDGIGANASFNQPYGVAVDNAGNVFVADLGNHRIRKVAADGTVTTLVGSGDQAWQDGVGLSASFYQPCGVVVDNNTGNIFVADMANNRIRYFRAW